MSKWEPWQKMIMVLVLLVGNLVVWLDAFEAATELRVTLGIALAVALGWAGIRRTPPAVIAFLCLAPLGVLWGGCAAHVQTDVDTCWTINSWNFCVDGQVGDGDRVGGCIHVWPVDGDEALALEFCGEAGGEPEDPPAEPVNEE